MKRIKKTVIETLCLLVVSGLAAFGTNGLSPAGIPLKGQWDTQKGVVSAKPLSNEIEINDPDRVRKIVENRERVVLDVRPRWEYLEGHLPGAHSFPLEAFDDMFGDLLAMVTPETPILVYCSGMECEASHEFADHLTGFSFTDVRVYGGGFRQWEEMGFEIAVGG